LSSYNTFILIVVIVSFTEREYNVSEGAGSVRVGLQLNRVIDQMFSVQIEIAGITAAGYIHLSMKNLS